jgi:hypothetical protein
MSMAEELFFPNLGLERTARFSVIKEVQKREI